MKLSFVIPAYNEEAYLKDCLLALERELKHGNYDAEVIVVNNASTDGTKAVAAAFSWVKVVDEEKKGLVRARARGFLESSGELIANVDSDTRLTPGWIDRVLSEFARDERLVALSGPFIYFDCSLAVRAFVSVFYVGGYLAHLFSHYVFHVGAMLQGGNFVVRRSAMEAVGGYDMSIEFYGEDTDIAKRLAQVGRVKWTFQLPMYASGRRLKGEGVLTMGAKYALNYFWTTFTGKPFTKKYIDIRENKSVYPLENES